MLSPDGKAAIVAAVESGNRDIFLYDLARGLPTRFTFDPANDNNGIWSPDGKTIVFTSNRKGRFDLYRKAADGSGTEQLLYADTLTSTYPAGFSPDGKSLLYWSVGDPKTGLDIWVLPDPLAPSGASKPFAWLRSEFNEGYPQFSSDGKWVAYQSNESGRNEVYVAPFPGPGRKWRVSVSGGAYPRWRRDDTELFYVTPNGKLMAAAIRAKGGTFEVLKMMGLVDGLSIDHFVPYDVSADGQRILALVSSEGLASEYLAPVNVVQNWAAELKK